jgi:hypothetical protein
MTDKHSSPERNRYAYALLVLVAIALGLGSRRYAPLLPPFVAAYAGDTLWAMMVFFGLATAFPKKSAGTLAATSLTIAFLVEFSQLYHAPWLDALRANRLGALVLGQGFLWSDLLCYCAGVTLATLMCITFDRAKHAPSVATPPATVP